MRYFAAAIAAVTSILLAGGCDSSSDQGPYYGPYTSGDYDSCRQYTSCGSCTPISGCGWCLDSNGQGECVSDPDFCSTPAFTWTWNETGCRIPAEAGLAIPTAGDDAEPAIDATPEDAATVTPEDAALFIANDAATSSPDAGPDAAIANAGELGLK
jgi:hypothetical protein